MEKMPYRSDLDTTVSVVSTREARGNWQSGLPVLHGEHAVLRELRASDAASLFALLTAEAVARFIWPPPTSVEGFERFIDWTLRQRTLGTSVCFAAALKGFDTAVGIFQAHFGSRCPFAAQSQAD
jgi:RimJ/RimL family protein N-acetyltransferase